MDGETMNIQTELFPMDEESFSPELAEAMEEYMSHRGDETVGRSPLTADQLPEELKQALGIDIFPDEIVDAILALNQQLVEYAASLTEQLEQEGGSPFLSPAQSQRFTQCYMKSQPTWKEFKKEIPQLARTVNQFTGTAGKALPGWTKPVLYGVAAGGWAMGGQLGTQIQCYRDAKGFGGALTRPATPPRPITPPRPMGR